MSVKREQNKKYVGSGIVNVRHSGVRDHGTILSVKLMRSP